MSDPIYMRKATVLAKLESTPGDDALPAGANAMRVKDFTLTPMDATEIEYSQIQPHFGNFSSAQVDLKRKLDLTVYLAGSGTAGTEPVFDPLLQVCGHQMTKVAATSVTYTPISSAIKSATIYTNIDGQNYRMTHARGSVVLTTDASNYPVAKFSLWGLWLPVVDAGLPAINPAASALALPVGAENTTLQLHGLDLTAASFGLDVGSSVKGRHLIGYNGVQLVDRKASYSVKFESVPASVKNWEELAVAGTLGGLALTHGTLAGNRVAITSTRAGIGKPSISDMDGIQMTDFSGRLVPSVAGNDEYALAFT